MAKLYWRCDSRKRVVFRNNSERKELKSQGLIGSEIPFGVSILFAYRMAFF